MTDGNLAGIAADDVPTRGHDGIEQHQRAQPLLERRREHQRIGDHNRQQDKPDEAAHHVVPVMSCHEFLPSVLAH